MNIQILLKKEQKLEEVKRILKTRFIGVDSVIDQLIQHITPWYLTPSLLDRPLVINLWGMTGVGKTDLVRQLAQLLNFEDRFAELLLSHGHRSAYSDYEQSVTTMLHRNHLLDTEPKILLFDEIQHFRSIDQDGREVTNRRYQDFWELLSDGQVVRKGLIEEFEDLFIDMFQDSSRKIEDAARKKNAPEGENIPERPFVHSGWAMRKIRKFINTENKGKTSKDFIQLDPETILKKLEEMQENKELYKPLDLSKSLIIISGNLDALYKMSSLSSESEIDASIFHEQTKKLNITAVKQCLQDYFRPEEISRMGNTHIIYPSLNKPDFEVLIRKRLEKLERATVEQTGVTISFDDSITALIYRNGVFPTQGVRPVFSAVSEIVTSRLASWLLLCAKYEASKLEVSYLHDSAEFCLTFPDSAIDNHYASFSGNLDLARSGKSHDEQALVAVHESGHALMYALCFGLAPLQLKSRLASAATNGFAAPHTIELSAETLFLQMQVLAAGALAEELIYGRRHVSTGHSQDLQKATALASLAIRELGFSEIYGTVVSPFNSKAQDSRTDIENSNELIAQMLELAKQEARGTLIAHSDCLVALSQALTKAGMLEPAEFMAIADAHGVTCTIQPESWIVMHSYAQKLKSMI